MNEIFLATGLFVAIAAGILESILLTILAATFLVIGLTIDLWLTDG